MSIAAKPRYNPCVGMSLLVKSALYSLEQPDNTRTREIYFNNIFRMLEVIKYDASFREYNDIKIAFDLTYPKSMSKEDFVELAQESCRLLGVESPYVLDDNKRSVFVKFLSDFRDQLNTMRDTCKTFE